MPAVNEVFIQNLIKLAIAGLEPLYDTKTQLFSKKYENKALVEEDFQPSIIYTATTILGLLRAKNGNWTTSKIDENASLTSLVNRRDEIASPGVFGLLLWADAHCGGNHREEIYSDIKHKIDGHRIKLLPTYELSWLLTGLCYSHNYGNTDKKYAELVQQLYHAITENMNPDAGLFGYMKGGTWPKTLRNRIGNFADQIYSVYALTTFYETYQQSKALKFALKCANRLCELQGDMGQWWWHYQSKHNLIASKYPVYAVHQDGMAPMTLLKLSKVSGEDYQPAVNKGLHWLTGNNELCLEMVDWQRNTIWRDIRWDQPRARLKYVSMATASMNMKKTSAMLNEIQSYKINYEMRSYHLGWLLYAFADMYEAPKK